MMHIFTATLGGDQEASGSQTSTTDFATKISQDVSGVIAGKTTVDEALDNGQKLAQAAGDKYKGK